MSPVRMFRRSAVYCVLVSLAAICAANPPAGHKKEVKTKAKTARPALYVVGYSHLDTEWCWTYPQVIMEFIPNTLHENFALFGKYPDYVFNWTGSNRYRFMKEYYPEDYAKLKQYVAEGKWFPAGSSVEEGDVNSPSEESLVRQVMYGNEFFRKEFGKQSSEFMLPDCFGFPASLPSILVHCGLNGFSTQKLTWGSPIGQHGYPFDVGVWKGPDGAQLVCALNPGAYDSDVRTDLATDSYWINRLKDDQEKDHVAVDYKYYGVGDRGGAPDEESVKYVQQAVKADGPVHVFAGRADQMFNDLSPEDKAAFPVYQGDLELTQHSAGSLSSESAQKRWNRKNELLADATERASVAADWLGGLPYDKERITDAWLRFLPGQFHDLMAGTALPQAYNYAWNDQILAMNEFAGVLQESVGAVARSLNTQVQGVPLVVYNPLSIQRNETTEATVTFPKGAPAHVRVFGANGSQVPSQVVGRSGTDVNILFSPQVASIGFAVYDVRPADSDYPTSKALNVSAQGLENLRYKVRLGASGDVVSVFDKKLNKELLAGPARLVYEHENPSQFPAWNMDWNDQKQSPRAVVGGPAQVKIVENGPVRVALQVKRRSEGSTFVQTIRLSNGDGRDRVEFATRIDWRGKESALKAEFPLTASNPQATYNWELGTIQRGNDDPRKYEVAAHRWIDLTNTDGSYGVSLLDDCKYGSDKPNDNTLRLTLLYTPGVRGGYQHQATQDWGRNEMIYALEGHPNSWQDGDTQWQALMLNQPMRAFQTVRHPGSQSSFSMASSSNPNVQIEALKQAEDGNEIVVRLNELAGASEQAVQISWPRAVVSAREIDGQERPMGPAKVAGGSLVVDMTPYHPRAFAIKLTPAASKAAAPVSKPLNLPFNGSGVTTWEHKTGSDFDDHGDSLPGELLPAHVDSDGVTFHLGPRETGKNDVMGCDGQVLNLPAGKHRKLYLLAASADHDRSATFSVGSSKQARNIQAWDGYVGQWDNREWGGQVPELAYDWHNPMVGLEPGYIKRAPVAWYADHKRLADGSPDVYNFCYMFRYELDVPDGATTFTLPKEPAVKIMAATVSSNLNDDTVSAAPLYDVLDRSGTEGPSVSPAGGSFSDSQKVTISPAFYYRNTDTLHYTLDGSMPTAASPVYGGPMRLNQNAKLRMAQIDANGKTVATTEADFRINDTTPPGVTSATAMTNAETIRVDFSEPVDKSSAENPSNYRLSSGETVASVRLQTGGESVLVTLSSPVAAGTAYTIDVDGVLDLSPNRNASHAHGELTLLKPAFQLDAVQTLTGSGTGVRQRVADLPTKGDAPWTINFFVYMDQSPEDLTPIAGFGSGRDDGGAERFMINSDNSVYFWGGGVDISSGVPYDLHRWQMISATYDGQKVRIYKDGKEIKSADATLSDAASLVRVGPPPAWGYGHQFTGKVAGLSIWNAALSDDYLRTLLGTGPAK